MKCESAWKRQSYEWRDNVHPGESVNSSESGEAVTLLILASSVMVGSGTWCLVLLVSLRSHRIDLEPHEHFGKGSAHTWQGNVTNRNNYSAAGRRLLRWLRVAQVLWLCGILMALYSWATL